MKSLPSNFLPPLPFSLLPAPPFLDMTLTTVSTPHKPLPTLPTELILDIFRNHRFRPSDLARFALVSRRLLLTIQSLLYEKVPAGLILEVIEDGDGEEDYLFRLSMKSWALLQTLQNRPDLANLVRGFDFDIYDPDTESSEVVMDVRGLCSTFFGLAQEASDVVVGYGCSMGMGFDVMRDGLRRVAHRIKSFETEIQLEPEDTEFILTKFTSLRRLRVNGMLPPASNPTPPPILQLEEYINDCTTDEITPIPFLDHSAPTLRRIALNVAVALNSLDYSKCTSLQELAIFQHDDYTQGSHNQLWTKLALAPSLEVLKLEGQSFNVEADLFSEPMFDEDLDYEVKLRKLRRIDIRDKLPLNRLAFLLNTSMFPNLREVVVSYTPPDNDGEHLSLVVGARAMCEAKGINLILSGWYC